MAADRMAADHMAEDRMAEDLQQSCSSPAHADQGRVHRDKPSYAIIVRKSPGLAVPGICQAKSAIKQTSLVRRCKANDKAAAGFDPSFHPPRRSLVQAKRRPAEQRHYLLHLFAARERRGRSGPDEIIAARNRPHPSLILIN